MRINRPDLILEAIETLINDFIHRYNDRPNYVKVPMWVKTELREYAQEMLVNFNYKELEEKKEFRVFGLLVCETLAISRVDEIEVF